MKPAPNLVVFTDLDGTLLDHDSYQWTAARPALERLALLKIPIVLASSKTAAEVRRLQRAMSLTHHPAIVENGAGVIGLRDGTEPSTYTSLRAALAALPNDLCAMFRGFGDMDATEVVGLTGLALDAAKDAKARDFSEPGIWSGDDRDMARFQEALSKYGITAQRGGRFLTLSFGRTKADAMRMIEAVLKPQRTLALGDAPNDIDMLEAADFGVIVANPHSAPLPVSRGEETGRIIRTKAAGPTGWNAAVLEFLETLDHSAGRKNG
jgi:mannosyl-3-phosphoglycerate phosphatase